MSKAEVVQRCGVGLKPATHLALSSRVFNGDGVKRLCSGGTALVKPEEPVPTCTSFDHSGQVALEHCISNLGVDIVDGIIQQPDPHKLHVLKRSWITSRVPGMHEQSSEEDRPPYVLYEQ